MLAQLIEAKRAAASHHWLVTTSGSWSMLNLIWILSTLGVSGCGNSVDPSAQERVAVSGRVLLDGRPLQAGAILFHAADDPAAYHAGTNQDGADHLGAEGNAGGKSITAFGFVENGRYKIDQENGPPWGRARVEFRPKPIDRVKFEIALQEAQKRRRDPQADVVAIPEKYGDQSILSVELMAGIENKHDFDLNSR